VEKISVAEKAPLLLLPAFVLGWILFISIVAKIFGGKWAKFYPSIVDRISDPNCISH
jgi:hypothetical protein